MNDPLIAQGTNTASYAAWALGEAILEDLSPNERFCLRAAERFGSMRSRLYTHAAAGGRLR